MVKIGVADAEAAKNGSSYEAVDLLGDEETGGGIQSRERYVIESAGENESTSSSGSSSSDDGSDLSEGSSGSSVSDDGDSDEDSVSDTSSSEEESSSGPHDVNNTADTEKHRNFMKPVHRSTLSPAITSPNRAAGRKTPPPPSTFEHKRRFKKVGLNMKRDMKGRHRRLPVNEEEAQNLEKKSTRSSRKNRKGNNSEDRKPLVAVDPTLPYPTADAKPRAREPFYDPSQFPLEQCTDAEYGIRGSVPPDNYSFASADPTNIDYEPKPLKKMGIVDNRIHDENRQKRIICWGLVTAMIICLLIMIGSVVAYEKRINVHSPPKNLVEVCSMKSIGTEKGHRHCEKACREAECCMASGVQSCFLEQEDVCSEYAPCGTIHTNYDENESDWSLVVPPAPTKIEEICSDANIATQSGFLECQATCNPGLCCLPLVTPAGVESPERKPCWSTHEDVCKYYSPCQSLAGLDEGHHGSPVDLVNLKCTSHNLKFLEGKEDCETICQSRSCCFAESKHRNCREDNEVWCNNFAACELLLQAPDFDEPGPDGDIEPVGMEVQCLDVAKLDNEDQLTCKEICRPAVCCFYEDADCENHIDCPFYEFCYSAVDVFPSLGGDWATPDDHGVGELDVKTDDILIDVSPVPSPKDVDDACADLSTSHGEDECYFHCSNYRCCFQDDYDPISCHESRVCDKYISCKGLEDLNSNDEMTIKSSVDGLCSVHNLLIVGGFNQCENVCAGNMCCFKSEVGGCSDRPECQDYEGCEILMSDYLMGKKVDGSAEFDVEEVCSVQGVTDDTKRGICEAICVKDSKTCCFGVDDASNVCDKDCCENLPQKQPQTDQYPKPQVNLHASCSINLIASPGDSFYEEQCVSLCKPAECCRDNTCRDINDFCEHYIPCFAVWGVDTTSNLSDSCEDKTSAVGKAICDNACKRWECCWGDDNCFADNNDKCVEAVDHCKKSVEQN